jgi:hypothetical protein
MGTAAWDSNIELTATEYSFPMSDLETIYGYQQGDLILVQIKSNNFYGDSPYSTGMQSQLGLRVVPHQMQMPTRNALTTQYQLVFDFVPFTAPLNGDSEILGYHAMWKADNSADWVDVNPENEQYQGVDNMNIYDGLVVGQVYNLKVRARNVYGFGEFSDTALITASTWPSKPENPPVTETAGTNVRVTFKPPVTNGDVITGFNILFKQ